MSSPPPGSVTVIGASLAGLVAAYHLARLGHHVTILDDRPEPTDLLSQPPNQPTYLLGCYRETWALLQQLHGSTKEGPPDSELFLTFRSPEGLVTSYRGSRFPGPVHWLWGLARFTGLSRADRWRLLSYLEQLWEEAIVLPADLGQRIADEWLDSAGQSQDARERIWNPLTLWLTGNQLTDISAASFVEICSKVFLTRQPFTSITQLSENALESGFAEGRLYDRFIAPLTTSLLTMGAVFRTLEDSQLQFEREHTAGIRLPGRRLHQAQWYISALPRRKLLGLLPERLLTRFAYFSQMDNLKDLSGLTVRLTCQWTANAPRLLLLPGPSFLQLSLTPFGPTFVNIRLSTMSDPSVETRSDADLVNLAQSELRALLPEIQAEAVRSADVLREEHAALSMQPGSAILRPIQHSPIKNLLVAGSWTDTGWPANIESAIVSGKRCAEIIAGHSA